MSSDDAAREAEASAPEAPRERFELDDRGFREVPKKYRKFYRKWEGKNDVLGV
jgi:hypothetical protein